MFGFFVVVFCLFVVFFLGGGSKKFSSCVRCPPAGAKNW